MRMRKNMVWMFLIALLVSITLTNLSTFSPEIPVVYVDPTLSSAPPGETFDVYVSAGPVVDLFLAEFFLSWDPPLLYTDIASITTGDVAPFLEFILIEEVNNDEGWLHVTVGRPIGVKEGLTGIVQIAKITFLVEAEGACPLHFFDNPDTVDVEPRLKNSDGDDLERTVEDGRFEYPIVEKGSIAGTVTHADTMLPIEGATVTAVGPETRSTTTATDGTYTLADIEVGDYSVTASATGYEDQTKSATVIKGEITTLNFELTPIPTTGTIAGTVTDADTGLPIEGATVTADGYSTTTAADGTYLLADLPAGDYTVEASAAGYESASTSATVVAGETTTVNFALAPLPPETGTIAGTVTDADTMLPIEGATVTANGISTSTNAEGYYEIEIEVGTYDVTAEASGYISQAKVATVTAGETTTVNFALVPIVEVGWIDGYVTDADTGLPLEGATVSANGYSDTTDSDGYYNIKIVPGTYDVTAEMTGYVSQTEPSVSVAADQTVTVSFALEPVPPEVGWIEGHVTDAETTLPIEGAAVTADGYSATTDSSGYYKIEVAAPATYDVTAEMTNYLTETVTDVFVDVEATVTVDFALTPIEHDVAITSVVPSPLEVTVGEAVDIDVTVVNEGNMDETFDLTVYYDSIAIGTQADIFLSAGASTTSTFTWDTTGVAEGTYTIKAEVPPVPGETDVDDNKFVDGEVRVLPPVEVHDVAITSVTASPTTVKAGETVSITVVAENQGTETETFGVTVYYDDSVIGTQTITDLAPGASRTLSFSWDTTGVAEGNYIIKAIADIVPGETDIADNTYVDGTVTVTAVPPVLTAKVDIKPETLNLKSKGRWVICYIQLPEGYDIEDIDVSTILMECAIPAEWAAVENGVLMVKFDRAAVIEYIQDVLGITDGEVTLTITGELVDGTPFEGSDTISVIPKGKKQIETNPMAVIGHVITAECI